MQEKNTAVKTPKEPRFGPILLVIMLSVCYILVTRIDLMHTYFTIYASLDDDSQVKGYFIISFVALLILSVLCVFFLYAFFKRKIITKKLLLYIYSIYILISAASYLYGIYVVDIGVDIIAAGYINNLLIDIVIFTLFILYAYLSERTKAIFTN
ncbi:MULTISPECIES: DUF2569 family protein [unclassified Raoultella]|uniref:DUF2569 family protein n=1 Tax=unclassified Raoultella TaxID=2627600 RepID=UPI00135C2E80|nr:MULTISPECIES: DUF2569 family protein [unclassified Raoultella]